MNSFSVLISVYEKDNAKQFKLALASIFQNTLQPYDVVLIVDGPVKESLKKSISILMCISLKRIKVFQMHLILA